MPGTTPRMTGFAIDVVTPLQPVIFQGAGRFPHMVFSGFLAGFMTGKTMLPGLAYQPGTPLMTDHPRRVTRALLSVSDKSGLIKFARALAGRGVELVSTGGTSKAIA